MRSIDINDTNLGSVFERVGKEWMLVTAGDENKCNTMTASWGGMGVLWNKNVATIYIRPERYTYGFVENEEYFTLSFLSEEYRKVLSKCGSVSGRDVDKIKECNLTVKSSDNGGVYFDEANLTLVCRKIYAQDMDTSLMIGLDPSDYYGSHGGVHRMYIGEIVQVLTK